MGGAGHKLERRESTGMVYREAVHGFTRLLGGSLEEGERFWRVCADLQSRNPAFVARALSLMSGSGSMGSASSTDVDMTSNMSPTEREAALAKLFGQCALVETLLAEGGEFKRAPIFADS